MGEEQLAQAEEVLGSKTDTLAALLGWVSSWGCQLVDQNWEHLSVQRKTAAFRHGATDCHCLKTGSSFGDGNPVARRKDSRLLRNAQNCSAKMALLFATSQFFIVRSPKLRSYLRTISQSANPKFQFATSSFTVKVSKPNIKHLSKCNRIVPSLKYLPMKSRHRF